MAFFSSLWGKFKLTVDWFDQNKRYVMALLGALGWLLTFFGWTAPHTAAELKNAVLGQQLARAVEVVDRAR